MPPVSYNGELRADFRFNEPEGGESSLQQLRTAQLNASSYVWRPWFATLNGNFALTQSVTEAQQDSEGLFASGGGSFRLFPVSRFPFESFVSFTDSRTEFADPLGPQVSDFQTLRFGARQDYRPISGRSSYTARVERIVQTDDIGSDDTTDLFQLATNQNFETQRFNLDLNIDRTEREQQDSDTLNKILNGRHNYRPNDSLSVETFANVTDLIQENPFQETRFTRADVNSFAIWRSRDRPLTVDANARLVATRDEVGANSSEFFSELLRVGARYDLSERLRLSGNVSGALEQGEAETVSTTQDATATYQSADLPLRGFSYNWSTSGTVSNSTETGRDATQRLSWSAGHGLSRVVPFAGSAVLTGSLNQNVSSFHDTDEGSEQNLNHNGTVSVTRSGSSGSSSLTLILSDSRIFGREVESGSAISTFQSATLQGTHFQNLSRFSSWNASLNFQGNRFSNGSSETFTSSSVTLSYNNSRVFGVRRLRFESTFESSANSLDFVSQDEEDSPELSWDNRLDYTIGLLDIRLRGTVVDRAGQQDVTVFLTIRRLFDGRVFDN